MSYILDALKRADAERERGTVPGLHARQATAAAFPPAYSGRNRIRLAGAAALVLGGVAAAALWLWQPSGSTVRVAAVEPAAVAKPPVAAAPGPVAPTPPQLPAQTPVPPPATAPATASRPAPVAAAPAPVPAPARQPAVATPRARASSPTVPPVVAKPAAKPAPSTAALESLPAPAPSSPSAAKTTAPAAASAPTATATPSPPDAGAPAPPFPAAIPLLSELPENIRRQVPPLAITGSVYSQNPGQRLLLVNNQVLAQGGLAAPELTLEQIQAKGSVFVFRGTRFRVAH
ncbi:MAG: hypothetical protein JWR68_1515 [Polaromonas sp.]|nr:hypothetical protein [Polaromonas sp.]